MKKRGPWTIRAERLMYQNPWMHVREYDVVKPDGKPGLYGVMEPRFVAVGICPVFGNGDTVLVGQHRFTLDAFSWELPEGGAPRGEDTLETARRELAEETGLSAAHYLPLTRLDMSNSVTSESAVAYLAWDLIEGAPNREGSEADMEMKRLPLQTALAMAMSGEIRDAFSVAMLASADYLARTGALEDKLARAILTKS